MTQFEENKKVVDVFNATKELQKHPWSYYDFERLYHCSADTFSTERYIFLKSYNTVIACIDKTTGECFDWLRLVYGYTATSAQHICKFMRKFGATKKYTWRLI